MKLEAQKGEQEIQQSKADEAINTPASTLPMSFSSPPSRVIILGGTGFLGRVLCKELRKSKEYEDAEIIVLTRRNPEIDWMGVAPVLGATKILQYHISPSELSIVFSLLILITYLINGLFGFFAWQLKPLSLSSIPSK